MFHVGETKQKKTRVMEIVVYNISKETIVKDNTGVSRDDIQNWILSHPNVINSLDKMMFSN